MLDTDAGRQFVCDMAQFADGTLSEKMVRRKWRLDNSTWETLGLDDELVEAIETEKLRRMRNGSTKRELAQQLIVAAPNVLSKIMLDDKTSPRHKVDAVKVLDQLALVDRKPRQQKPRGSSLK
jgi:hypothetical protein